MNPFMPPLLIVALVPVLFFLIVVGTGILFEWTDNLRISEDYAFLRRRVPIGAVRKNELKLLQLVVQEVEDSISSAGPSADKNEYMTAVRACMAENAPGSSWMFLRALRGVLRRRHRRPDKWVVRGP